jgi:hypothetical protein
MSVALAVSRDVDALSRELLFAAFLASMTS